MCGCDSGVGGLDAIYIGLVYTLCPHTIFLNQTKHTFESFLFSVHILKLILSFCTLNVLYLHHLVHLIMPMNQVSSRMKLGKTFRKIMDLLEECLAQVLEFALQLTPLACDLLQLAFLV